MDRAVRCATSLRARAWLTSRSEDSACCNSGTTSLSIPNCKSAEPCSNTDAGMPPVFESYCDMREVAARGRADCAVAARWPPQPASFPLEHPDGARLEATLVRRTAGRSRHRLRSPISMSAPTDQMREILHFIAGLETGGAELALYHLVTSGPLAIFRHRTAPRRLFAPFVLTKLFEVDQVVRCASHRQHFSAVRAGAARRAGGEAIERRTKGARGRRSCESGFHHRDRRRRRLFRPHP